MTPEQEHDYQEALRRIKEAAENKNVELDLGKLSYLTRFPPELAHLTSLQTLNLSWCNRLSGDLSPLAELTSLQSLNLSSCAQLSGDLSPLTGLTSLQSLNLSSCFRLSGDIPAGSAGVTPIAQTLLVLSAQRPASLRDLPSEVCGSSYQQNVLDEVRAHYKDLEAGQRIDAEVNPTSSFFRWLLDLMRVGGRIQ
jgi:Leucine-rich repeat (LRR) protein